MFLIIFEICRKLMKKRRGKKMGERKELDPQGLLTLKSAVYANKRGIIKKHALLKKLEPQLLKRYIHVILFALIYKHLLTLFLSNQTVFVSQKTDPNQAGSTANKRKDSKTVVQPPAEASKQPTAANKVQRTAEVVNTTSHGGIFRKFKPPSQSSSRQCLGVEPIPGQKYTSLKNLQDAGKKKQKELLKKN